MLHGLRRMNLQIHFIHLSIWESVHGGEKPWRAMKPTFCVSHSILASQIPSLPAEAVCDGTRFATGVKGTLTKHRSPALSGDALLCFI